MVAIVGNEHIAVVVKLDILGIIEQGDIYIADWGNARIRKLVIE